MYINYGDRNFLTHGLLIDTEHSDTVFEMLICDPYPYVEDLFQFAHITVDIEDDWIDWEKVKDFMGMEPGNNVDKAIMAYEYYGAEQFGADSNVSYDWKRADKETILREIRNYLIAWDNVVLE